NGPKMTMSGLRMTRVLHLVATVVMIFTAVQFVECAKGCDCSIDSAAPSATSQPAGDHDGCLCCSLCLGSATPFVLMPELKIEPVSPSAPEEPQFAPIAALYRPPRG